MALSAGLASLGDAELERLREALRVGRLHPALSAAELRARGLPEAAGALLAELGARGWSVEVLGELVELALAERSRAKSRRTEVVCTRPRVGAVEVLDTSVAVRRLFLRAEREVLIAGFRVTEREQLEPLRRRAGKELDLRLFVDIDPAMSATGARQAPVSPERAPGRWCSQFLAEVWPEDMDPPRVWYAPSTLAPDARGEWSSMHVKSVVIDRREWFVSSANFTRRGHGRNIELGALITDPERAAEVVSVFEQWIGAGVFQELEA